MPYKSDKQRRYMHAKHPKIARRWDAEIGKGLFTGVKQGKELTSFVKPTTKAGKKASKEYLKNKPGVKTRVKRAVSSKAHNAFTTKQPSSKLDFGDKLYRAEGRSKSAYAGAATGLLGGAAVGTAVTKPKKNVQVYKAIKIPKIKRVHKITDLGSPKLKHENQMYKPHPGFRRKPFIAGAAAGGSLATAGVLANPDRESRMKKKPVAKREQFAFSSEDARSRVNATARQRNMYASKKNKGRRAANWKTVGTSTGVGAGVGAAAGALTRTKVGAAVGGTFGGIIGADVGVARNSFKHTKSTIEEGKKRGDVVPLKDRKTDWKGVVQKRDSLSAFGVKHG